MSQVRKKPAAAVRSGVLTERTAPACAMTDLPQTDSDFRGSLPYEATESMFHAYA